MDAVANASAQVRDVTDDLDGSDILSAAPSRRIPLYVTIPVVLACGLIGYGLSLALPLYRASAPAAPAAAVVKPPEPATSPAKGADAGSGRQDASHAGSGSSASMPARQTPAADKPAAAAMAPPSRLGRGESPAVTPVTKAATPAPSVETGSVEHAAQPAKLPAGDKTTARPTEKPEAARAEPHSADQQPVTKRADGAPRKRVRRVYRPRAQPKTAKGPFETLFPALAK